MSQLLHRQDQPLNLQPLLLVLEMDLYPPLVVRLQLGKLLPLLLGLYLEMELHLDMRLVLLLDLLLALLLALLLLDLLLLDPELLLVVLD
jgi:hypothetical protein